MAQSHVLDLSRVEAVIFDLDGVLTSTAEQHARAWQRLFDPFLERRAHAAGHEFVPFDRHDDYLRYVDGKPRYDGVASFLQSRDITLPRGEPADAPGDGTICALGNQKDAYYHEVIREEGIEAFPSSVRLLDALAEAGTRLALISASRNTFEVIEAADIADRFDAIVDGVRSESLGIAGKPAPDIFRRAATDLGVSPGRAAVIEDAEAGIEAGRQGEFGLVIGVERTGHPGRLTSRGADIEVADLASLEVAGERRPFPSRDLPAALETFEAIRARAHGRPLAIFLDYDGTLTPIVDRPELAVLGAEMRSALEDLASSTLVAIVSGRDLDDVRRLVDIPGLLYSGSHGFQWLDPGGRQEVMDEARPYRADLIAAAEEVEAAVGAIAGVLVERKGFAVATHYRLVEAGEQPAVSEHVRAVAERYPRLRVTGGKMVIELRPALPWDKGKAVNALLDRLGGNALFPVYIGDDETDEDAFRALRGRGAGIVVGDVPDTQALLRLDEVEDVGHWLRGVREQVDGGTSAR